MVAQVSTIPYAARCLTIIASAIALSTSVSAKPEVENDADTEAGASSELSESQVGIGTEKEEPVEETTIDDEWLPAEGTGKEKGEGDHFGHGMQAGLRASLIMGYRMSFRYDDSPFCRVPEREAGSSRWKDEPKEQAKVCGFGAPAMVDVALSFAPFDSIEPFLFGRFGLDGESETNTQALRVFGAGLRIYTMSDSRFKLFVEPSVGYETEGGGSHPDWTAPLANSGWGGNEEDVNIEYKENMYFHLAFGPQFDFAKGIGLYGSVGLSVAPIRAIDMTMEAGIGLQVRAP